MSAKEFYDEEAQARIRKLLKGHTRPDTTLEGQAYSIESLKAHVSELQADLEITTKDRNGVMRINEQHRDTIKSLKADNERLVKQSFEWKDHAQELISIKDGLRKERDHYQRLHEQGVEIHLDDFKVITELRARIEGSDEVIKMMQQLPRTVDSATLCKGVPTPIDQECWMISISRRHLNMLDAVPVDKEEDVKE